MSDNLPAKQDDSPWPTRFWPEDANANVKYTDEKLLAVVQELADTNDALTTVARRNGVPHFAIARLRNTLPDFDLAIQMAYAMRRERLNDEILEIADEELPKDPDLIGIDLAHRKLKMDARKTVIKHSQARQKSGMDTFTLNVGSGKDGQSPTVNIQIVNYGEANDKKT